VRTHINSATPAPSWAALDEAWQPRRGPSRAPRDPVGTERAPSNPGATTERHSRPALDAGSRSFSHRLRLEPEAMEGAHWPALRRRSWLLKGDAKARLGPKIRAGDERDLQDDRPGDGSTTALGRKADYRSPRSSPMQSRAESRKSTIRTAPSNLASVHALPLLGRVRRFEWLDKGGSDFYGDVGLRLDRDGIPGRKSQTPPHAGPWAFLCAKIGKRAGRSQLAKIEFR